MQRQGLGSLTPSSSHLWLGLGSTTTGGSRARQRLGAHSFSDSLCFVLSQCMCFLKFSVFCPGCKEHRQASKKLDLWRLPEVLVIHLERFSYIRFLKNKLETYVDFLVDDLDLSTYIGHQNGHPCNRYMLYVVSNHFGSMGGGHYTTFVHHYKKNEYMEAEMQCPNALQSMERKLRTTCNATNAKIDNVVKKFIEISPPVPSLQ